MKKSLIMAILITPFISATAMAAPDNVGCGLGSTLFDGQSGTGPQILAVTTNGTSGNQTFGITSGTLGCEEGGVVQASAAVQMFVGSNLDALSRDMSIGAGESLESLATLMEIKAEDKTRFFSTARAYYDRIFSTYDITAGTMLENMYSVMAEQETLAKYVRA